MITMGGVTPDESKAKEKFTFLCCWNQASLCNGHQVWKPSTSSYLNDVALNSMKNNGLLTSKWDFVG